MTFFFGGEVKLIVTYLNCLTKQRNFLISKIYKAAAIAACIFTLIASLIFSQAEKIFLNIKNLINVIVLNY